MSPSSELSINELAHGLGLDRKIVRRYIEAGMPRRLETAKLWRQARIRPYQRRTQDRGTQEAPAKITPVSPAPTRWAESESPPSVDGSGLKLLKADASDDLGAVVQWLRDLTKSYWNATTEAVQAGDTARADALARQLQSLTRNLASTERIQKGMEEKYGGLVSRGTMVRFWMLYKKAVDRCVMELPESRHKAELIDTLDRITVQFSVDLKLNDRIA